MDKKERPQDIIARKIEEARKRYNKSSYGTLSGFEQMLKKRAAENGYAK